MEAELNWSWVKKLYYAIFNVFLESLLSSNVFVVHAFPHDFILNQMIFV